MSGQPFERLIRLEDEELETAADDGYSLDGTEKDSIKVPMISNGSQHQVGNIDNLFTPPNTKHKFEKITTGASYGFVINGRHIQMNPEQLKYISLITLTVQNAALNLTMRGARTQTEQFSTSVAVTVAEFLKLLTCLALTWYEESTIDGAIRSIKSNIVFNYMDTLKVAVPSFLYYVQNNLLYVGSTHLDAATSQVTYQLKILTTAIFSVLMLNKKLSRIQWIALVTLFVGVALIETMVVSDHKSDPTPGNRTDGGDEKPIVSDVKEKPLMGFLAILIACCLSGFAGVYFEKILKNSVQVSLWIRNIQLSLGAILIGFLQLILTEQDHLSNKGFFYGFTPLTWFCIALQVQGGLLVAVVIKFANNILKGFATSLAIVISTVASIFIFNFNLTPSFMFGASLVIGSVMMYNKQ